MKSAGILDFKTHESKRHLWAVYRFSRTKLSLMDVDLLLSLRWLRRRLAKSRFNRHSSKNRKSWRKTSAI